jgi:hypothetical protein
MPLACRNFSLVARFNRLDLASKLI